MPIDEPADPALEQLRVRCQEILHEIQRAKRSQRTARELGEPRDLNAVIIQALRTELKALRKKLMKATEAEISL